MEKKILIGLMVFASLLVLVGCTQQVSTPTTNVTQQQNQSTGQLAASVAIKNFAFDPISATIAKGGTVTWTNEDSVSHTITGDDFDSGTIANGASYSHVFDQAGEYAYHCSIHASMKGTIIVK